MTRSEHDCFFGGLLLGLTIGLAITAITASLVRKSWQRGAIEHNAAEYHPTTGVFQWKEPVNAP